MEGCRGIVGVVRITSESKPGFVLRSVRSIGQKYSPDSVKDLAFLEDHPSQRVI